MEDNNKEEREEITLKNSKEPDSLICQFMELVSNFFNEKTEFKTLGFRELPTATKNAIQVSVTIAKKGYEPKDENYAAYYDPVSANLIWIPDDGIHQG